MNLVESICHGKLLERLKFPLNVHNMAIGVVEFSREGYKIRKDFA